MKEIRTNETLIRVHSPEITKEKSARRMRSIKKAAEKMLKNKKGI